MAGTVILKTEQKFSMDCPTNVPQFKTAAATEARKSSTRLQQYVRCYSVPNTKAYLSCKKDKYQSITDKEPETENTSGIILKK